MPLLSEITEYPTKIVKNLNDRKYYSAASFDVSQAFDEAWRTALLIKIKQQLRYPYYLFSKSYSTDRPLEVKIQYTISNLYFIYSDVPRGRVLSPVLYTLFTADLPTKSNTIIATYTHDTVILATDVNPDEAAEKLQSQPNEIAVWLKTWKMETNVAKLIHITFATRTKTCPAVSLNAGTASQQDMVKYLDVHLDRLTWEINIQKPMVRKSHILILQIIITQNDYETNLDISI